MTSVILRSADGEIMACDRSVETCINSARAHSAKPIAPLTGLRGVAALWVVAFHVAPQVGWTMGLKGDVAIVDRGYLAVDFFFMLSGFVLSMAYQGRFQNHLLEDAKRFAIGRIARILPLNTFVLCLLLGLVAINVKALTMSPASKPLISWVACLLLIQTWWPGHSTVWNYPAWSLSAEWFTYATFPALAAAVGKMRSRYASFGYAALCLAALAFIIMVKHSSALSSTNGLAIVRCLLEFYAGALVFQGVVGQQPGAFWLPPTMALAELCMIAMVPGLDLLAPWLFAILIVAAYWQVQPIRILFGNPVAYFLGEISFSIYLIHAPLLLIVKALIQYWPTTLHPLILPAYFGVLIGLSYLSYRWIERPFKGVHRR